MSWVRALAVACVAVTAAATPQKSFANSKYAAIVVDGRTGEVLFSRNADAPRYPASLTKMMTLYLLFDELKAGRMKMTTRLKVSRHASRQAPSKLGLKPGSTIQVRDAIRALVTKSANDVAVVVAENIGGTESAFARRMTRTAHALGMSRTTFRNASGLPNSGQRTTARDMATLGRALQQHHPKYYRLFKTRYFKYRGRTYGNHNRLLGRMKGIDGIKTGYIRASGFNLVSSYWRGKRHLVATVMGGRTGRSRNAHMAKLLRRFIGKASTHGRTDLIARAPSSPGRYVSLPKSGAPRPVIKPGTPIVTASIVPRRAPVTPVAANGNVTIKTVRTMSVSIGAHNDPKPVARIPTPGPSPVATPAPQQAAPKPAPVATPRLPDGWQIQIAAVPSRSDALTLMKRARDDGGRHLASATPYTEAIEKGGVTLYRARFAGFSNKNAARSACRSLKRKSYGCFALNP